jgi:hypothetical protein
MSSYAEMARHRKQARPLYLELKSLGLQLRAEDDPGAPLGYRVVVCGFKSLSQAHADRVRWLVQDKEVGLVPRHFGFGW